MSTQGGCLCGQIRYEFEGSALAAVCHCTNCQKQSGSAFSVNVLIPAEGLQVTGEMACYDDEGDSGNPVKRKFCAKCGSPIISELADAPLVAVKAGTLDDTSEVKPGVQVYCDSKQAWLEIAGDMPGFPKSMPTA